MAIVKVSELQGVALDWAASEVSGVNTCVVSCISSRKKNADFYLPAHFARKLIATVFGDEIEVPDELIDAA